MQRLREKGDVYMVTPPSSGPWVFVEEGEERVQDSMVEDFKETVFYKVSGQLHTGTHGSYDSRHKIRVSSRHTNSQCGGCTKPHP